MRIIPLGSNGWIPREGRATSSFLVEVDSSLIILDAGTGLFRLKDYNDTLSKYDDIHIILSHYHLDHIIGLSYIPLYLKDFSITIWGPGKKYYDKSCEDILKGFTSYPYFSNCIKDFSKEMILKDYDESGFSINNINIHINKQIHSSPSFGISIKDYVCYATDTEVIEESFQRRFKLILHECWTFFKGEHKGHSSLQEIKEMAYKYNNTIGLIHLNPRYNEEKLKEMEDYNIFVVNDGEDIVL